MRIVRPLVVVAVADVAVAFSHSSCVLRRSRRRGLGSLPLAGSPRVAASSCFPSCVLACLLGFGSPCRLPSSCHSPFLVASAVASAVAVAVAVAVVVAVAFVVVVVVARAHAANMLANGRNPNACSRKGFPNKSP